MLEVAGKVMCFLPKVLLKAGRSSRPAAGPLIKFSFRETLLLDLNFDIRSSFHSVRYGYES
jgi:hypothetical protein